MNSYHHVLVDAKNEYTKQLIEMLTYRIYEGIKSIYSEALDIARKKYTTQYLKLFQNLLSDIPKWTAKTLEEEYKRIILKSDCDWMEDLITAVFVTHAKVLASIKSSKNNKSIDLKVPTCQHFIHKTYIETARQFWKMPYLLDHTLSNIEMQRNLSSSLDIISKAIEETIRKQLPVKNILKEYLGVEYINNKDKEEEEDISLDISSQHKIDLKNLVSEELKNSLDNKSTVLDENYSNYSLSADNNENTFDIISRDNNNLKLELISNNLDSKTIEKELLSEDNRVHMDINEITKVNNDNIELKSNRSMGVANDNIELQSNRSMSIANDNIELKSNRSLGGDNANLELKSNRSLGVANDNLELKSNRSLGGGDNANLELKSNRSLGVANDNIELKSNRSQTTIDNNLELKSNRSLVGVANTNLELKSNRSQGVGNNNIELKSNRSLVGGDNAKLELKSNRSQTTIENNLELKSNRSLVGGDNAKLELKSNRNLGVANDNIELQSNRSQTTIDNNLELQSNRSQTTIDNNLELKSSWSQGVGNDNIELKSNRSQSAGNDNIELKSIITQVDNDNLDTTSNFNFFSDAINY